MHVHASARFDYFECNLDIFTFVQYWYIYRCLLYYIFIRNLDVSCMYHWKSANQDTGMDFMSVIIICSSFVLDLTIKCES